MVKAGKEHEYAAVELNAKKLVKADALFKSKGALAIEYMEMEKENNLRSGESSDPDDSAAAGEGEEGEEGEGA